MGLFEIFYIQDPYHHDAAIRAFFIGIDPLLQFQFLDLSFNPRTLHQSQLSTTLAHFYEEISALPHQDQDTTALSTPDISQLIYFTTVRSIQSHPLFSQHVNTVESVGRPSFPIKSTPQSHLHSLFRALFLPTQPISIYPVHPISSATPNQPSAQRNQQPPPQPPNLPTLHPDLTPIYAHHPTDFQSSSSPFHSHSDGADDETGELQEQADAQVASTRPSLQQAASQHSSSTQFSQSHLSNRPSLRPTNSAHFSNNFIPPSSSSSIPDQSSQAPPLPSTNHQRHASNTSNNSLSLSNTQGLNKASTNPATPTSGESPHHPPHQSVPQTVRRLHLHPPQDFLDSSPQSSNFPTPSSLPATHNSLPFDPQHSQPTPQQQFNHQSPPPSQQRNLLNHPHHGRGSDSFAPFSSFHSTQTSHQLISSPPIQRSPSYFDQTAVSVSVDPFNTSHYLYNQSPEMLFDPYWIKDDEPELLHDSRLASTTSPHAQHITRYCPHLIDLATQANTKLNFLGGLSMTQYFFPLSTMAFNSFGPEVYVGGEPLSEMELLMLREKKLAKKLASNPLTNLNAPDLTQQSSTPSAQGPVSHFAPNSPLNREFTGTSSTQTPSQGNNTVPFIPSSTTLPSRSLKLQPSQQTLKQSTSPSSPITPTNATLSLRPGGISFEHSTDQESTDSQCSTPIAGPSAHSFQHLNMAPPLNSPSNTSARPVSEIDDLPPQNSALLNTPSKLHQGQNDPRAHNNGNSTILLAPWAPNNASFGPNSNTSFNTNNTNNNNHNNNTSFLGLDDDSDSRGSLQQLTSLRQSQAISLRFTANNHSSLYLTANTAAMLAPSRTSFTSQISASTVATALSTVAAPGSLRYDPSYGPPTHFLYRHEEFTPIRKPSARVRTRVKNYTAEQHPNIRLSAVDSTTFKCIAAGMANGYEEDCYESFSLSYNDPLLSLRYGSQTAFTTHYNTAVNHGAVHPTPQIQSVNTSGFHIHNSPPHHHQQFESSTSSFSSDHTPQISTCTFPACCYTHHTFSLYLPALIVGSVDFTQSTDENVGRVRQHLLQNRAMYCTCGSFREKHSTNSVSTHSSGSPPPNGQMNQPLSTTSPSPILAPAATNSHHTPPDSTSLLVNSTSLSQSASAPRGRTQTVSGKDDLCEHCEAYKKHLSHYGKQSASADEDDERSTDHYTSETDFSELNSPSRRGSTNEFHSSPLQQLSIAQNQLAHHSSQQDGSPAAQSNKLCEAIETTRPRQVSAFSASPLTPDNNHTTPQIQYQLDPTTGVYLPIPTHAPNFTPPLQPQCQLYSCLKTSPNYIPKERRRLPSVANWHQHRCEQIVGALSQSNQPQLDDASNNSNRNIVKPGQGSTSNHSNHSNHNQNVDNNSQSIHRSSFSGQHSANHLALFKPRDSISQSRLSSKHDDAHRSSLHQLDGISPAMYHRTSCENSSEQNNLERDLTLLDSTAPNSAYYRDRDQFYGTNNNTNALSSANPNPPVSPLPHFDKRNTNTLMVTPQLRRASIDQSLNSMRSMHSNQVPNELSSNATGATPSSARLSMRDHSEPSTQGRVSIHLSSKKDAGPGLLFTMNEDEDNDDSDDEDENGHKSAPSNAHKASTSDTSVTTKSQVLPNSPSSTPTGVDSTQSGDTKHTHNHHHHHHHHHSHKKDGKDKHGSDKGHHYHHRHDSDQDNQAETHHHHHHHRKRHTHVRLFLVATDIEQSLEMRLAHEKSFLEFVKTIYDYGDLPFVRPSRETTNILILTSKFTRISAAPATQTFQHAGKNLLAGHGGDSQTGSSGRDSLSYDLGSNHSQFNPISGLTPFQLQLLHSSSDNNPSNLLNNIDLQFTIEPQTIRHQTWFLQQDELRKLHARFYIPPHLLQKEAEKSVLTEAQLKEQRRKQRVKEQRRKQKEIRNAVGSTGGSLRQQTAQHAKTTQSDSNHRPNDDSPRSSPRHASTDDKPVLSQSTSQHSSQVTQNPNKPPLPQYATYIPLTMADVSPDPKIVKVKKLSALDKRFCRAVQKFVLQTLEIIPDKQRLELLKRMINVGKYNHYTFLQLGYLHKARDEFRIEITNMNARDVDYVLILDDEYLPSNLLEVLFPHNYPVTSHQQLSPSKQSRKPSVSSVSQTNHKEESSGPLKPSGIHVNPPPVDEAIAAVSRDPKELGEYHITPNIINPNTRKSCSPEDVVRYYSDSSPWQNLDFAYLNKLSLAEIINIGLGVALPTSLLKDQKEKKNKVVQVGALPVDFDLGPTIPFPFHPHHLHPYYCPFSALINSDQGFNMPESAQSSHSPIKASKQTPPLDSIKRNSSDNITPQKWATSHIFKHVLRFGINYKCFDNQNNLADIIWLVKPKTNSVTRGIGKAFSFFAKSFGMKKDWSRLKVDGEDAIVTFDEFQYRKRDLQAINEQIQAAQAINQDTSQLEFNRRIFLLHQTMDHTYSIGHPIVLHETSAQKASQQYSQMQAELLTEKTASTEPTSDPPASPKAQPVLKPGKDDKPKPVKKFLRFSTKVDVNSVNDKPRFKYTGSVSHDGLRKGGTNSPTSVLKSSLGDYYIYTVPIDINLQQLYSQSFVLQTSDEQGMGMNYTCYKKLLEGLPFAVVPRGRLPLHEKTYDGFGLSTILKQQARYRVPTVPFSLLAPPRVLNQLVESSNDPALLRRKKDLKQLRFQRKQQHYDNDDDE